MYTPSSIYIVLIFSELLEVVSPATEDEDKQGLQRVKFNVNGFHKGHEITDWKRINKITCVLNCSIVRSDNSRSRAWTNIYDIST